jgi:DeoR/GlpR family transcriptional regulator of sugar metabolism
VVLGGQRTPSEALVGPVTVHALDSLHADLCFMGVHGFDPKAGITSPNLLESEVNAAMIAASDKLAVLADATKYGTVALAGIAPLSAVGVLITDDRIGTGPAGHDAEQLLRQSVGELRLAPMKQDPTTPDPLAPARFAPHPPSLPDGQPPSGTAFKGHDA